MFWYKTAHPDTTQDRFTILIIKQNIQKSPETCFSQMLTETSTAFIITLYAHNRSVPFISNDQNKTKKFPEHWSLSLFSIMNHENYIMY